MPWRGKKTEIPPPMTTEKEAIDALVRATVRSALSVPCHDGRTILRGLLALGGEHESLDAVRVAYRALTEGEHQLEQIARIPAA